MGNCIIARLILPLSQTIRVVAYLMTAIAMSIAFAGVDDATPIPASSGTSSVSDARPSTDPPEGMVWIPGGELTRGSPDSDTLAHAVSSDGGWRLLDG